MFDEHYSLYLQCFPDYPVTKALFDEKLCPEKGQLFERREGGKLTGFLLLHENSIPLLCVDSAHRGRGIGSALLQEAEDFATENGAKKIVHDCGPYYLLQGVPADFPEAVAFSENTAITRCGPAWIWLCPLGGSAPKS